jgi:hypothetical protein
MISPFNLGFHLPCHAGHYSTTLIAKEPEQVAGKYPFGRPQIQTSSHAGGMTKEQIRDGTT